MSSGTPFLFFPAKKKLLTGGFVLSTDTLKAALCTNAQALSAGFLGASADARFADLTGEVSGTGYTAGGLALSGVSLIYYVASVAIVAGSAGTGGTTGTQTVTGTTGTGTKFTASVTVTAGAISAIISVLTPGSYSVLPTDPTQEPVTGGGLTGAKLNLGMGRMFTCSALTWSASTFTAKYLVVYDNTQTNKDLLFGVDLETTLAGGLSIVGGTLTYTPDAVNGVFTLN